MAESLFVITGVNKGLGLVILKQSLLKGLLVESVSKSPRSTGVPINARFTQLDCSDPDLALRYWENIHNLYGSDPYITLINNAGMYVKKSYQETDFAIIKQTIQNNFFSSVNMTKGLTTYYRQGTIVNIISSSGMKGAVRTSTLAQKSAYSASKAAEAFFFSALQDEFDRKNYRIMNFFPYTISTWTEEVVPGCIKPVELADWIIMIAQMRLSFTISDCVIVPFENSFS